MNISSWLIRVRAKKVTLQTFQIRITTLINLTYIILDLTFSTWVTMVTFCRVKFNFGQRFYPYNIPDKLYAYMIDKNLRPLCFQKHRFEPKIRIRCFHSLEIGTISLHSTLIEHIHKVENSRELCLFITSVGQVLLTSLAPCLRWKSISIN